MTYSLNDWKSGAFTPKGWDCADAVSDGGSKADLEWFMCTTARPWTPARARAMASQPPGNDVMRHQDIHDLVKRIVHLTRCGAVTIDKGKRLTPGGGNLLTLTVCYWLELRSLIGCPLPNPGCRTDIAFVHPFVRNLPRDFEAVSGYFRRFREYVQRLESKYGMGADDI